MRGLYAFAAFLFLTTTLPGQDKKKDPDAIGDRDVSKGINFYSIEKEMALGKQLAQQVMQNSKVVDDAVISEYVNRLAQNLARNSDAKMPLTTHVLDAEDPNAVALPGGHFFVNTGLILTADTEAELAGAMAHEIAHIAARHGTRQASEQQLMDMATIPLIFMGGWAGVGARQAAGVMAPMAVLGFKRAYESEADMLGLQYLYKTGYDPGGMVDIFEKIESMDQRKHAAIAKYFSTHPPTGDRIVAVQKNIQEMLKERPEYVVTTSEFNEVKARLVALQQVHRAPPEDPKRPTLRKRGNELGGELVAAREETRQSKDVLQASNQASVQLARQK